MDFWMKIHIHSCAFMVEDSIYAVSTNSGSFEDLAIYLTAFSPFIVSGFHGLRLVVPIHPIAWQWCDACMPFPFLCRTTASISLPITLLEVTRVVHSYPRNLLSSKLFRLFFSGVIGFSIWFSYLSSYRLLNIFLHVNLGKSKCSCDVFFSSINQ